MGKNLVIVESPAKAKTINKILGKDYVVKASMGHIRDLPERKLGVDVEHDFKPEYVSIKGRSSVLKELKSAAKSADAIYLAPDPDREGEAIAWHLQAALANEVPEDRFYRVTYNEITAPAIREAFSNPGRIDMHRVDSQQARRVLDRLVGYQVSPLLWRRIRGSRSAGRVQSVALRLVCEREKEILAFVPEEYWILGARVRKKVDPRDPFILRLAKIDDEKPKVGSAEEARKHLAELDERDLVVSAINERQIRRKAPPPFITSTLQQAASSVFSYSPDRTMRIAQRLYEGMDFGEGPAGLITYMRTDSVSISAQARDACRAFVEQTFGADYVPEKLNIYRSRGGAQEAHEAIRPTEVTRTPEELAHVLKPEELKLYRLIWQRFVASQMEQAVINQRTVEASPAGQGEHTYLFRATTSEIAFPGYMKVTGQDVKKKKAKKDHEEAASVGDEVDKLPPLAEGEAVDREEWLKEQKFTQPPARFSEASLVRALEENGVGRPSTYAQVLSTLDRRDYVEKEKRSLKPTELGMNVNDFLVGHLSDLFDVGFTAQMEESLDEVERGHLEWTGMLDRFYSDFRKWVAQVKGPDADPAVVEKLLGVLGGVTTWNPPVKRGNRTYSDEKFVISIRKQIDEKNRAVSARQLAALVKIVGQYKDQLPQVGELMEEIGMTEVYANAAAPKDPPRDETLRKLDLLKDVQFDEPRTSGKRTYDDAKFCASLREQVEGGKRLSENQVRYLDRLVLKYAEQIPEFEKKAADLGLEPEGEEEDHESGPLLELLGKVGEWKPPVQRGKREWDDKKFYESLQRQFKTKKALSVKQRAALKKMCGRYGDLIPGYEEAAVRLGLPARKEKKSKRADAAADA